MSRWTCRTAFVLFFCFDQPRCHALQLGWYKFEGADANSTFYDSAETDVPQDPSALLTRSNAYWRTADDLLPDEVRSITTTEAM